MPKALEFILKNKNTVFAVLLFFVLVGVFSPKNALAEWRWCGGFLAEYLDGTPIIGTGCSKVNATIEGITSIRNPVDLANATLQSISNILILLRDGASVLRATPFTQWPALFVTLATTLISTICFYIAYASAYLFRLIINTFIGDPSFSITRDPIFLAAWATVRDWANMFIVLGLIAVAVIMILRPLFAAEYNAKKFLRDIIIIALLINLSIVFIGLIIDGSNIVMRSLTVGGDKEANLVLDIDKAWNKIALPEEEFARYNYNQAMFYAGINLFFNTLYILTALALLYFTLIIIQRHVVLVILFVLSPLAFVFRALPHPKAQEQWTKWWQSFLRYCFIGIAAAFFLRLSVSVLGSFPPGLVGDSLGEKMVNLAKNFFIVIAFLVIGLRMAVKSSGPIINAVLAVAAAIGAAIITGGASLLTTATGTAALARKAKDVGTGAKDIATKSLERIGLLTPGTTLRNQQERLQQRYGLSAEQKKSIDTLRADELKTLATEPAFLFANKKKKAYAIQKLAETGLLNTLPLDKQRELAQYAIDSGISADVITKGRADLVDLNKGAVSKYTARGLSLADAKDAARRDEFARRDNKDINELSEEDYIKIAEEEGGKTDRGAVALNRAIKEGVLHKVHDGKTNRLDLINDALKHAEDTYGAKTIRRDTEKADYRFKKYDKKRVKELETSLGLSTADAEKRAVKEQFKANLPTLSDTQLRNIETSELTLDVVKEFNVKQIRAFETADSPVRAHLKTLVGAITADAVAIRPTNRDESNRLRKIATEILALP